MRARVAARKDFLTDAHKRMRLQFAREFADKDDEWWKSVIFSDEKTFGWDFFRLNPTLCLHVFVKSIRHPHIFSRSQECGRSFVYRTNGTKFQPGHIQTVKRSGRQSASVWAWFSSEGAGEIHRIDGRMTAEKYVDMLDNVLLPTAWARFGLGPIRFVQDLSPIHTSKVVREWFLEHPEFEVLPWPPKGADLNPIENLWSEMVREMETQHCTNSNQLWNEVKLIWDNLRQRQNYWAVLANSMTSRLQMVRDVSGDWTKY